MHLRGNTFGFVLLLRWLQSSALVTLTWTWLLVVLGTQFVLQRFWALVSDCQGYRALALVSRQAGTSPS